MQNKKTLAILSVLRKIFEIFSSLFFNIYLFQLVSGDFNFILLYAAFNAIIGCIFSYFLMKYLNSQNATFIFRLSFTCEILCVLLLLILNNQVINIIWLFALVQKFAKVAYYAVYEVTLIQSTRTHSLSSYIAGTSILGSIVSIMAPIAIGYTITNFSWHLVFIFMLIDTIIAAIVTTQVNFQVINASFRLREYWQKAFHNPTIRSAYFVTFLKRLSGNDGILEYLLPILLLLALHTEFNIGSYESLFSVVYIILLEVVRILNRKHIPKRIYIPLALLSFSSAAIMLGNSNSFTTLLFYFTIKTGGALIMTEDTSMIYAVGRQEKLQKYTHEHQFTWNLALNLGSLTGIAIAYVIYNYFYTQSVFAVTILILMFFFVIHAYYLQKIEIKLQNG